MLLIIFLGIFVLLDIALLIYGLKKNLQLTIKACLIGGVTAVFFSQLSTANEAFQVLHTPFIGLSSYLHSIVLGYFMTEANERLYSVVLNIISYSLFFGGLIGLRMYKPKYFKITVLIYFVYHIFLTFEMGMILSTIHDF